MDLYSTLLYGVTSFLLLFIGLIILLRGFKLKINLIFFGFILSVVLYILSIYFGYYFLSVEVLSTFFIRLTFGFGIFATYFLLLFSFYYPEKCRLGLKLTRVFSFLLTLTIAMIASFTDLIYEKEIIVNGNQIEDIHGVLHFLFIIGYLFNSFLAIGISFNKIKNSIGTEKKKMVFSLIGILIIVFGGLVFYTILPIFGIYLLQTEVVVFNLVFVLLVFYSMVNYRFLNISDFILIFFRNFLLFSFSILAFYFAGFVLHYFGEGFLNENILDLISIIFAIFVFRYLDKNLPILIETFIDNLKNETVYLKSKISYCNNFSSLLDKLEKSFIEKLHFSSLNIFVFREKESDLKIPYLIKDNFFRELKKNKKQVLVYEEIDYLNFTDDQKIVFKKGMENIGAKILFPLYSMNNLIGIFVLGDKSDRGSISTQEYTIFENFREGLEFSFMNVLLKEALEEENDLMKKIINKKTETLEEQNKEVSKLLKQQSDFIAVAAHEFRTPLSIALFQIEDTLDTHKNNPEISDEMNVIQNSLDNITVLTKNLFETEKYDLEKIEIQKEELDISSFLKEIVFEAENISLEKYSDKGKQISFENSVLKIGEKMMMSFDEAKIRQVFLNLITNAIKFSSEEGKIKISFFKKGGRLYFSVEDDGEGVPDDKKDFVFDKFRTNHLEKSVGIGLGLYLCKKIIELHGGKIWIEDSKNLGGAKIIFCLK